MISIYKTSLIEEDSIEWLEHALNDLIMVLSWNVDYEDHDNILRVESTVSLSNEIIEILTQNGHNCVELI